MDKSSIEDYLRFKMLKSQQQDQQNTTNSMAPRDRKMSQEYFKEEAKRLDKKLLAGKHLKQ